jgi:putative ABC transport system ATP-binding protein
MIRFDNVTKTYASGNAKARTALAAVSCTIAAGAITALAGPSGSGKTTFLSLVGAMARPTSGRIHVGDQEITSLPEHFLADLRRRSFGFVFQNYQLIHGVDVARNVMLPALPLGHRFKEIRRRCDRLLEALEIADFADQRVERLSGGEQQRVAIARALINDPQVVIADEPTAHLDADLTARFMAIAGRLRDQGKTLILASHDPLVCDAPEVQTVIRLRDGRRVDGGGV